MISKYLYLKQVFLSTLLPEQLNPKPRFQTSLGHAVPEVQIWVCISLGCQLCKERGKRDTVNKCVYVGDDIC